MRFTNIQLNQIWKDIESKFAGNEIKTCATFLVSKFLSNEKENYEIENEIDFETMIRNTSYNLGDEHPGIAEKYLDAYTEDDFNELQNELKEVSFGHCISDYVYEEIYEWWAVSEWMYNALKQKDTPVLNIEGMYFWGRTTTGQSWVMDGVIRSIYMDFYLNVPDWEKHLKLIEIINNLIPKVKMKLINNHGAKSNLAKNAFISIDELKITEKMPSHFYSLLLSDDKNNPYPPSIIELEKYLIGKVRLLARN